MTVLRQWRDDHPGVFQRDVVARLTAAGVELDQRRYSELERGHARVDADTAAAIAAALELDDDATLALLAEQSGPAEPAPRKSRAGGRGDAAPRGTAPPAGDADDPPPRKPRSSSPASSSTLLETQLLDLIRGKDIQVPTPAGPQAGRMPGLVDGIAFGCQLCARVWWDNAPMLAHAWAGVAEKDRRIRRALEALTRLSVGGAWTEAAIASAMVVFAMMMHHGILPGFGAIDSTATPTDQEQQHVHPPAADATTAG